MGLDIVDLVIGTEDAFGIAIPDEDAERLDTAGKLYEYILAKLDTKDDSGTCLTSKAFYKVRKSFIDCYGLNRHDIRPQTAVESLLPEQSRRERWAELEKSVGCSLPSLCRTRAAASFVGWTVFGVMVLVAIVFRHRGLAAIAGAAAIGLACLCTTPFMTSIPRQYRTIGDLTRYVLLKSRGKSTDALESWDRDKVWEVLRALIVERLRVDPCKVTKEASFYKDLGAG